MATPANLNPLWIISLFLGLTEVCVTTAAALTEGGVQLLFAWFSVLFATAVSAIFFVILWKKNHVLYAPRDYGTNSSPGQFVKAMRQAALGPGERLKVLHEETDRRDSVADEVARDEIQRMQDVLEHGQAEDVAKAADSLVKKMQHARHESQVRIDLNDILGDSVYGFRSESWKEVVVTLQDDTTVQDVLDFIYFSVSEYIDPYSYGSQWVLEDAQTGKRFLGLGSDRFAGRGDRDARLVGEVGITPGMSMRVARLHRPRSSASDRSSA